MDVSRIRQCSVVRHGLAGVQEARIQIDRDNQTIAIPLCVKPARCTKSYALRNQILSDALLERAQVNVERAVCSTTLARKSIDRGIDEAVDLLHR
jgi:hypothetical protein